MLYSDFKTTFGVLLKFRGPRSQERLFFEAFGSGIAGNESRIHSSDISFYINGNRTFPKWIAENYVGRKELLAADIESIKFEKKEIRLIASELGYNAAREYLTLSECESQRLERMDEWTYEEQLEFIADSLIFAMNHSSKLRPIDRNELALCDAKAKNKLPPLCENFFGREREIEQLGGLLEKNRIVYVCGEPGQGKTELVKRFLSKIEGSTVLWISFNKSWEETVGKLWMAGDLPSEDKAHRYMRHQEALRDLGENDILVIDGANVPESEDGEMEEAIAGFRCRTIVTTRCRHEDARELNVGTLEIETLEMLVQAIYPEVDANIDTVKKIIKKLHSHTFAVKLAASLLKKGVVTPNSLLWRLHTEGIKLSLSALLRIKKNGRIGKETFYNHISLLYSMISLDTKEREMLRGLWLLPNEGAYIRNIMRWFGAEKANELDDLIEKGYIQHDGGGQIFLSGLTQDVIMTDLTPTGQNCAKTIDRLCEISCSPDYYEENGIILCKMIERAIDLIEAPSVRFKLCKIVFDASNNYGYYQGMIKSIEQMEEIVVENGAGGTTDDASLWMRKATYFMKNCDEQESDSAMKMALELALENGGEEKRKQIVQILVDSAITLRDRYKYERAYSLIKTARDILAASNNFDMKDIVLTYITINNNLAMISAFCGRIEDARKALHNAETCLATFGEQPRMDIIGLNIAKSVVQAKIGDRACARKAVEVVKKHIDQTFGVDEQAKNKAIRKYADFLRNHLGEVDDLLAELLRD